MTWRRNILWLLPLVVLVSAPLWRPSLIDFLEPRGEFNVEGKPGRGGINEFTMEDVQISRCVKGVKEWDIKAGKIYSQGTDSGIQLVGVKALFYDKGKPGADISSGEAGYDEEKQIFTLIDDVIVTTRDGYQLRTPVLRYLARFRKIKTAAKVHLSGEKIDIKGTGLSYEFNTGSFRVGGRVSCNFM